MISSDGPQDPSGWRFDRNIAELLGLNLDVVMVRLHRGRVRLLQELKNHCKAEDWL
jgi:hypothetical protein